MCLLKLLVLLSIFANALGEVQTAPRITGGSDSHNEDYSKMIVSLREGSVQTFWGENHVCGGTFISADVVLTAAHCVIDQKSNETMKPHQLTVVAGSPNRLKRTSTTIELEVRQVIPHELYDYRIILYLRFDIAILKLAERATELYKESAEIVPLNDRPLEPKMQCTIAGFGRISDIGIIPPILLYANVTVWSTIECKLRQPLLFRHGGYVCVSDEEDPHLVGSACRGDSGGPLICDGKLAGVASFITADCGKKGYGAKYTDVMYFRRWIERNTAQQLQMPSFVVVAILNNIRLAM